MRPFAVAKASAEEGVWAFCSKRQAVTLARETVLIINRLKCVVYHVCGMDKLFRIFLHMTLYRVLPGPLAPRPGRAGGMADAASQKGYKHWTVHLFIFLHFNG